MLKTHGADILAITAGVGTIATGVCAYYGGKASVLQNDEEPGTAKWFRKQLEILAPTLLVTGATLACIGGSRHYGRLREKRLGEACALLAAAYQNRESGRRDSKANGAKRQHGNLADIEDTGTGDIIFTEDFTGRRFKASMEVYEYAVRKLQENFSICQFAMLNDFYGLLGIEEVPGGEVLAWTSDQMILDPDYIPGEDYFGYDEALTDLCIQLEEVVKDKEYIIHYNVWPVGSLAGIGPCNY